MSAIDEASACCPAVCRILAEMLDDLMLNETG